MPMPVTAATGTRMSRSPQPPCPAWTRRPTVSPTSGVVCTLTTFRHDGDDWQAMFAWGCASREGYTIGVLFLATTTNREVFGRLRGITPKGFEHATVDQLREGLIGRSPATTTETALSAAPSGSHLRGHE